MTSHPILTFAAFITATTMPSGNTIAATAPDASGIALANACAGHEGWVDAAPPARIAPNTWYVGTCGISAVLITSEVDGHPAHVLIDGGVKEAAPLVLANIRKLGFDPKDVRWLVASHEHYDHVGAMAELQRATGAKIAAIAPQARALIKGEMSESDPQYVGNDRFDAVEVDRNLALDESIVLGRLVLTARYTPAHALGSTSWTWQSCDGKFTCRMVAYADSATAISAKSYRFTDHPERIEGVEKGLDQIAALPCDILVTPHPSASNLFDRLAGKAPLIDSSACRAYAAGAKERFAARLEQEKKEARR